MPVTGLFHRLRHLVFIGSSSGYEHFATNQALKGSVNLGVAWVSLVGQGLGITDIRFFRIIGFSLRNHTVRIFATNQVSRVRSGFRLFRVCFLTVQDLVSVSFVLDCYNDVKIHSPTPPLQIFDTLLHHIDK